MIKRPARWRKTGLAALVQPVFRKEGKGQQIEFFRLPHMDIVPAGWENPELGSGDAPRDRFGLEDRHQRILGTMQHQHGTAHPAEKKAVEITARLEQRLLAGDIAI